MRKDDSLFARSTGMNMDERRKSECFATSEMRDPTIGVVKEDRSLFHMKDATQTFPSIPLVRSGEGCISHKRRIYLSSYKFIVEQHDGYFKICAEINGGIYGALEVLLDVIQWSAALKSIDHAFTQKI